MKKKLLIIKFVLSVLFFIVFFILLEYIIIEIIDKDNIIWISSKIKTFNNILGDNEFNYPILNFTQNISAIYLHYNYIYLLNHSTNNICENGFKKCGILDTYGNIMCLENNLPCPINEIIIDNKEKEKEYINKGFYSLKLNEIKNLYYTNNSIDKEIMIELKYSEEQPKLITEENLLIDELIYENITGKKYVNGSIPLDFKGYIINEINKIDNIDLSYKNISDNYYIKNYFGFKNYGLMLDFIKYNHTHNLSFQYTYYKIFHIFHLILSVVCFITIILNIYYVILGNFDNQMKMFFVRNYLFIAYIPLLAIAYADIYTSAEFLMNFKYILNDQIKELILYIRFRELTIIYLHFFSLWQSLDIIYFILLTNHKKSI